VHRGVFITSRWLDNAIIRWGNIRSTGVASGGLYFVRIFNDDGIIV